MTKDKIKIFVDGNCIVCDREVAHYKRLKPDALELIDISDSEFSAKSYGLTSAAVNKRMHIMMPNGKILTGVDAFLEIWKNLGPNHPHFQRLGRVISSPVIRPLADIGYNGFAILRRWLPKKK